MCSTTCTLLVRLAQHAYPGTSRATPVVVATALGTRRGKSKGRLQGQMGQEEGRYVADQPLVSH
eukprot:1885922-Rhodomonas_salina.2